MISSHFLFSLGNGLILPCWGLLIFFPNSRLTRFIFDRDWNLPVLILAVLYGLGVVPGLIANPDAFTVLARPTLEGVRGLLGSEEGAVAGWIHYLCFDLWVGISIWKSARKKGRRWIWVSPVLALVLMLGPLGWLVDQVASWGPGTGPRGGSARTDSTSGTLKTIA